MATGDALWDQLTKHTAALPYTFPLETNRFSKFEKSLIVQQARASYPIIHHRVVQLIQDFLDFKKASGSDTERALYATMTKDAFITRLLSCRPLVFWKSSVRK